MKNLLFAIPWLVAGLGPCTTAAALDSVRIESELAAPAQIVDDNAVLRPPAPGERLPAARPASDTPVDEKTAAQAVIPQAVIPQAAAEQLPPREKKFDDGWFKSEWDVYKASFLRADGRIVDNGNAMISHSEGQGYGMLLAVLAGDAAAFDLIWHWTQDNLMLGPEGLAAWKWDPQRQAVADPNNATDADILIAWSLAKASRLFDRADYAASAQTMAQAIGALLVKPSSRGPILMPAMRGFGHSAQPDGPIVNLSYYVFPAFEDFKVLAPGYDWDAVRDTGLSIIDASVVGPGRLPTDWEALGNAAIGPARNFPNRFGYDAIRIPLYLLWASDGPQAEAARFAALWNSQDRSISLQTGRQSDGNAPNWAGSGYRLIIALSKCVVDGEVLPHDIVDMRDDLYYPATLRLLVVAAAQERYPRCL